MLSISPLWRANVGPQMDRSVNLSNEKLPFASCELLNFCWNFIFLLSFDHVKYAAIKIEYHIFQKAQVTSNKMEPKKRHNFLAQFFMAFLMVWFILFQLLAFGTIK